MQHGPFTYYPLMGLRGDPDGSGGGGITRQQVADRLATQVTKAALTTGKGEQTPIPQGSGDFILVARR